MTFTACNFL